MAGIEVRSFNHTGFVVTDLDRAIGFFRDLLGFELLSRARRDPALIGRMTRLPQPKVEIVHLQGPGHRVELIRYTTDGIRNFDQPRVYDDGSSHLALDVDDVEAAVQASAATASSRSARSSRSTPARTGAARWFISRAPTGS